ncbi:MAG: PAS domain-containing sensor histidine kinase [Chloroflexota bacterium]
MEDTKKTRRRLVEEIAELRQRVAKLESESHAPEPAADLAAIAQLAMQLGNPPPDADLDAFITQTFHDLTGALATSYSSYEAESGELVVRHVITRPGLLSKVNRLLGRNIVGLRMPLSPETLDEMRTIIVKVAQDLSETTFGAVPQPIAAAIQKALGIGCFVGVALLDGDALIGSAVIVLPRGQALLSTPLLQAFAHCAATAIKRKQVEEALRASEEQYRLLIQNANEAIVVAQDGMLKFVNPKAADISGYSMAELLRIAFTEWIHPDDLATALGHYQRCLSGEQTPQVYQLRIIDREGRTRWLQSNAILIHWAGRPATLNFISDITEHKQALQTLQQSEEHHRTLMHNLPIGVYRNTPGPEGRFLMANPAFLNMFGLQSMEELQQYTVADFYLDPEERQAFSNRLLAQGSVTGVELRLQKKDGTPIWGSITAQVIYGDDSDQAAYFDCTIEDITARKRAEAERERLLQAEREQRLLAETLRKVSLALTSQIDPAAILDQVLQQAQRIVPYRTAHIVLLEGETLHSARWHGYQDQQSERYFPQLVQSLDRLPLDAQVIASREPRVVADTRQQPDWIQFDETAWVRSHLTVPICLRDRVLGLLRLDSDTPGQFSLEDARRLEPLASAAAIALENARLYDEVQRYAVEMAARVAKRTRELSEAYERLKELDLMKSKFVTDVSHELRTPVANIKLYLYLLDRATPEKRERFMAILNEQTNRLSNLIQTILDLSQLDSGVAEPAFTAIDMNDLTARIVDTHASRAEAAGLKLTFEPYPHLPPVHADRSQLGRVITNLLDNAINYTPAGQITLYTSLDEVRERACLQVTDTGQGISAQDLPHIFDRFYRGQDAGSSNIPGSGLGLAIVKEIVERHDGEITVETEPKKGATFRVWLPLA